MDGQDKKLEVVDVTVRDPELSDFVLFKVLDIVRQKLKLEDYEYEKMIRVHQGASNCKYYI